MSTNVQSNFNSNSRFWFKIGSASLILGTILITVLSFIHPHQADPNNNPAVFAKYAADADWLSTHLGQFFTNFMILVVATMSTGFSPLVGAIGMIAFLGGTIWVIAVTYFLWKMPGASGIN